MAEARSWRGPFVDVSTTVLPLMRTRALREYTVAISIRGDDDIGNHVREVLCLTRSKATTHFGKLHISGTEVVEYGEAADGLPRLLRSCIEQRPNENDTQF